MLAFGALIWAAPLFAQASSDPLAPLPATPPAQPPASLPAATQPTVTPAPPPIISQPAVTPQVPQPPFVRAQTASPPRPVVVPKDWRGVFDAIDNGNWASAQAGIAALPKSVLTPVARAELYTAK